MDCQNQILIEQYAYFRYLHSQHHLSSTSLEESIPWQRSSLCQQYSVLDMVSFAMTKLSSGVNEIKMHVWPRRIYRGAVNRFNLDSALRKSSEFVLSET